MDDPATFADRLPTPAELRNSYLRCCCFQAIPTEYRIFIHWVWDCIEEDWIPHYHQASWFPGDSRQQPLAEYIRIRNQGTIDLRPTREPGNRIDGLGTSFIGGDRSPLWNAWVDAYKNDFDAIVWNVAYRSEPEAEIQSGFNPWTFYRNLPFHQTGQFELTIFRADIIYEGNWNSAGKQHFHLPASEANAACRELIQNEQPLLGCLCRMVDRAYDINAVTVSDDVYTLPLPADPEHWPAPPPTPPEEWTDFLCGDCEDPATPPSDTADLPIIIRPIPPRICQALHEYQWDCDEEEWTHLGTRRIPVTPFPPGFEIMIGLLLWRYGSTQLCRAPAPAAPTPTNTPDAITIDEQCPPPSSCPCTSWLPSEWPCGGLVEQYSVDSEKISFGTAGGACNFGLRAENIIVTASPFRSCLWIGTGTGEVSFDQGVTWESTSININLELVQQAGVRRWQILMGNQTPGQFAFAVVSYKDAGQTPLGSYIDVTADPSCGTTIGTVS